MFNRVGSNRFLLGNAEGCTSKEEVAGRLRGAAGADGVIILKLAGVTSTAAGADWLRLPATISKTFWMRIWMIDVQETQITKKLRICHASREWQYFEILIDPVVSD
jgi:hypothetical protein